MEDVEIGMTQGREMKKGGLGPTWDLGVGGGVGGAFYAIYELGLLSALRFSKSTERPGLLSSVNSSKPER